MIRALEGTQVYEMLGLVEKLRVHHPVEIQKKNLYGCSCPFAWA
jgi:hypothetical protein